MLHNVFCVHLGELERHKASGHTSLFTTIDTLCDADPKVLSDRAWWIKLWEAVLTSNDVAAAVPEVIKKFDAEQAEKNAKKSPPAAESATPVPAAAPDGAPPGAEALVAATPGPEGGSHMGRVVSFGALCQNP